MSYAKGSLLSQPAHKLYHTRTHDELIALARDREVQVPQSISHSDLVALIIANPKFSKFTSLPPELRARVYSFYFTNFHSEGIASTFKAPLITLANRLLRSEALPQFYTEHRFEITLILDATWRHIDFFAASNFFNYGSPTHIAMIKKLRLTVRPNPKCPIGWLCVSAWDVDLKIGEKKKAVVKRVAQPVTKLGKQVPGVFSEEKTARIDLELMARLVVIETRKEGTLLPIDISEMVRSLGS